MQANILVVSYSKLFFWPPGPPTHNLWPACGSASAGDLATRPSLRGHLPGLIIVEKRYSEESQVRRPKKRPRPLEICTTGLTAHVHSSRELMSGARPSTGHILWLYVRRCIVFVPAAHIHIYIYTYMYIYTFAEHISAKYIYIYMYVCGDYICGKQLCGENIFAKC